MSIGIDGYEHPKTIANRETRAIKKAIHREYGGKANFKAQVPESSERARMYAQAKRNNNYRISRNM